MQLGVLALQGDFYLHFERIRELGIDAAYVKKPNELWECHGLIIPGGESTTLVKLLKNIDLYDEIPKFNKKFPVFGTCAGAILLSQHVTNHPVESFKLLDVDIERNAYGTQIDSFFEDIVLDFGGQPETVEAVFIRAPKFTRIGENVRILAQHNGDVVMVESENAMAATFHPELTKSTRIHEYFADKVRKCL